MVAYERQSLIRGSNYMYMIWLGTEILVFWKTGHLREVVTYESGHMSKSDTLIKFMYVYVCMVTTGCSTVVFPVDV